MKRITYGVLLLILLVPIILISCGKQDNLSGSGVTSAKGSASQVQSDISTPEIEDMPMRQVLIKRTEYDEDDNMLGWREYSYDADNQADWRKYDTSGKLLGYGIDKFDDYWNLIESLSYNEFGILVDETRYNINGDKLYWAYYSEDGTLQYEESSIYNNDGTKDSDTVFSKSPYGDSRYVVKIIYSDNGTPLRETWEDLDTGDTWNSSLYVCDDNNRIIEEKAYISGRLLSEYFYQYDEVGRIIEKRCEDNLPDYCYTITYTYNEMGNCLTEQKTYPNNPQMNYSLTNAYDENGFILKEIREDNDGTRYSYCEYDMIPVSST